MKTGGRFAKGRIIMTKHIESTIEFNDFMDSIIDLLRFPGMMSVDAHGFVQTKEGEPIFVYGSPNSAIKLWNGDQEVFLERKVKFKSFDNSIEHYGIQLNSIELSQLS